MTSGAPDHQPAGERFVVPTRRDEVERLQARILDALARTGLDQAACFAIRTAVEEAVANAVHHGNRNDPRKRITIELAADDSSVAVTVQDEGHGFDPGAVPDPTAPENVDIPAGRGIMLMRAYMTEVEYNRRGNRVRMRYERGGSVDPTPPG